MSLIDDAGVVFPQPPVGLQSLWPYRPRFREDELLTSYLIRVANGLHLKPITFLNAVWGSSRSLLNQDLDNFTPDYVVNRIAQAVDLSEHDVRQATLSAYGEALMVNYNTSGRNSWILPTTIKSNHRRRHGLQFCPACLASDEAPYFRRRWRLAFATICTRHGTLLRDSCPACGEVIHPHRSPTMRHCFKCGHSLCIPTASAERHDHIAWQASLERGLTQGWISLGTEFERSHVVFAIVRQIATLLVNGRRAQALRDATAQTLGGDPSPFEKPTRRQPLEYLGHAERHRLFDLVQRLMTGWPYLFVSVCEEAGFHKSHAIKDMPHPPFAYESVLRWYMDRTPYLANEQEVVAAANWLRRTTGKASYGSLKAICGESRAAIYKHMDYVRRPKKPSEWNLRVVASSIEN